MISFCKLSNKLFCPVTNLASSSTNISSKMSFIVLLPEKDWILSSIFGRFWT